MWCTYIHEGTILIHIKVKMFKILKKEIWVEIFKWNNPPPTFCMYVIFILLNYFITKKSCLGKLTGYFDINFWPPFPSLISLCTDRLVNLEIHWLHGTSSSLKKTWVFRPLSLWLCHSSGMFFLFLFLYFSKWSLFLKRKMTFSFLTQQTSSINNCWEPTAIQSLLGHSP